MTFRLFALPVALVAGLGLAAPESAHAAPQVPSPFAHGGHGHGGVRVGFGVGFPIGGGYRHTVPTGYWSVQTVPVTVPVTVQVNVPYQTAVQVPDHQIGTDVNGNPIWSYRTELRTEYRVETRTEYHTEYVTQRVWVDTGYAVHHHPSGWGQVGVGFRIR